mgnify:CR=1 FL=1
MDFNMLNLANDSHSSSQTGRTYTQADSSLYEKEYEEEAFEVVHEISDRQFFTTNVETIGESSDISPEDVIIQQNTLYEEVQPVQQNDELQSISESATDIVEIVDDEAENYYDSIEGGPYFRIDGRPIKKKKEHLVLYGTTDVAKMIGMSPQAIRNYCDYFEDYLQIPRKESGHRSFTQEHVDRLRGLIEIKDKKNLTFEQLKEYLIRPEAFDIVPESQKLEVAMEKMQELFENSLRAAISYISDSNIKLLEQKDAATAKVMSEVTEQLKKQDETITELLDVIKKERIEEHSEKDELLNETIKNLQDSLKERDAKIEEMIRVTERQNCKITELEAKKQKKFLGIF